MNQAELAAQTGTTLSQIRTYTKHGLIVPPYSKEAVTRVRVLQNCTLIGIDRVDQKPLIEAWNRDS